MSIVRDKIAFERERGGYRFVGTYLLEPKGEALIEITKDGAVVKEFLWPAYKIWNIPAHADDIIADVDAGLRAAGATGLGGYVVPTPVPTNSEVES